MTNREIYDLKEDLLRYRHSMSSHGSEPPSNEVVIDALIGAVVAILDEKNLHQVPIGCKAPRICDLPRDGYHLKIMADGMPYHIKDGADGDSWIVDGVITSKPPSNVYYCSPKNDKGIPELTRQQHATTLLRSAQKIPGLLSVEQESVHRGLLTQRVLEVIDGSVFCPQVD